MENAYDICSKSKLTAKLNREYAHCERRIVNGARRADIDDLYNN